MPEKAPLLPDEEAGDAWSLRLITVSGIPVRLHFTFLLMIVWLAVSGIGKGGLIQALFLMVDFFCIALHELGHSLVAQRLGYTVRDITLYPIGGVASMEGSPPAKHELLIALAGPAVNVVITSLLTTYFLLFEGAASLEDRLRFMRPISGGFAFGGFLTLLLVFNAGIVLFNMIPAFPMDGGRVLRALLALRIGRRQATRIAATIGKGIAILLGAYGVGFFGDLPLLPPPPNLGMVLISLFVFFGAGQEGRQEEIRSVTEGHTVRDAMVTEFVTLQSGDSLRRATEALLATSQQDFPVLHGAEVVGVLSRTALLRSLAKEGETGYVAGGMERELLFADPNEPLDDYLFRSDGVQRAPILVRDETGQLLGMVTMENVMEFLTLRQITRTPSEDDKV